MYEISYFANNSANIQINFIITEVFKIILRSCNGKQRK